LNRKQEKSKKQAWMMACVAALSLTACDRKADETNGVSPKATEAAGDKTLAKGIVGDSKFAAAIKAAGLEPALAGPTPYTLLVPNDAAFDKLSPGTLDALMKPEGRKELTAILTGHILPGTMLATDIGKAVDAGGGRAQIRTLGGGTVTATKSGDKLVITDATGQAATVVGSADERSNGVIHHIDTVLRPVK
jgi:uncharacterized surface protein with fasciclin (FAS1) repeats